jgi:hypothetical protein
LRNDGGGGGVPALEPNPLLALCEEAIVAGGALPSLNKQKNECSLSVYVLVRRIRIRIPDLYPCITYPGLDSDPNLFFSGFQDENKKYFFCLLTVGTFTSVFKENTTLRSHKIVEINNFLLVDGWIRT